MVVSSPQLGHTLQSLMTPDLILEKRCIFYYACPKCSYDMSMQFRYEPRHEISNNVVNVTGKTSDQPAHTRSLIRAFASRLNII